MAERALCENANMRSTVEQVALADGGGVARIRTCGGAGGASRRRSITPETVADRPARRHLGFGRGARMSFERDEATFPGGVRHGLRPGLAGRRKYGSEPARVPGSPAHDGIVNTSEGVRRVCGRAGETGGGPSTGEPLRARRVEADRDGASCSEDGGRFHRRGRTRPAPALRRHRGPRRSHRRRGHGGAGPCGRRRGTVRRRQCGRGSPRRAVPPRPSAAPMGAPKVLLVRLNGAGKPTAGGLLAERLECATAAAAQATLDAWEVTQA